MSTIINSVERDSRGRGPASNAPKPVKLDPQSWLCEVVKVTDGTGIGDVERSWWTEVIEPRYAPFVSTAEFVAETAAYAWYDETDQSGVTCEVVLRCTAWTGEAWIVEVPIEWQLKVSPRQAIKVTDRPAERSDTGGPTP